MKNNIFSLLLIAASIICIAYLRLKSYRRRIEQIQNAITLIRYIKRELAYAPSPMQEMFINIAMRNDTEEKGFFEKISDDMNMLGVKSFQQIWRENIYTFFPELLEDEKYELSKLGENLGYSPVETQLGYITSCEEILSGILCREKVDFPQRCKLHMWLSFAAAAAVVIVFI